MSEINIERFQQRFKECVDIINKLNQYGLQILDNPIKGNNEAYYLSKCIDEYFKHNKR